MPSHSLQDSRVVVTGAAGGVGRAVVDLMLAQGARVCATDLPESLAELQLTRVRGTLVTVAGDVTRASDVDAICAFAEAELGGIDVLVSNAGYIVSKRAHETSEEEWDSVMAANAKSFFLMSKRVLPGMLARRSGAIVATGSISSVVGLPSQAAYCASKGALLQLVRQMAVDYAADGIRINAVGPGSIATPFLQKYLNELDDPVAGATAIKAAHPLGRWAEPSEIAEAIVFLAGPGSSFVTGTMLMVDGGYSAR